MKDFLINFCMDRGFQPKDLMTLTITPVWIEYSYLNGDSTITIKEPLNELLG
jgi:hypothetical protein